MNVKAHPAVRDLREMILRMGARAEAILETAIRALRERNAALAQQVQGEDLEIDRLDVAIDEAVLRALALQAPLAEDLRGVVAIKTMAIDLERVGDLARNIAKSGARLAERPSTDFQAWLEPLETEALALLRRALDCFEAHDPGAARAVIDADDRIDALQDEVVRALIARIGAEPDKASQAVDLILVAESLERVADHATNIAEDVILIAEARNVKHAGKLAGAGG
jgi:phosphate transport system protein